METLLLLHEVDDVDHWLASPERVEFFEPLGITERTFRHPTGSERVGLIAEIPDVVTWEQATQIDAAAETMNLDGVRPQTIVKLVEG